VRRALIVMASASGTTVPAIARLVQADADTVRDVIHAFNQWGLDVLDPRWAGGRPRRINPDEERFIVQTARTRPEKLGCPFTHWSTRKLAGYLAGNPVGVVKVGRERLRQLLRAHQISFRCTRTWKESSDPQRDEKLDRIEEVTSEHPDRCFAFDQFGPLSIRPHVIEPLAGAGRSRAPAQGHRLPVRAGEGREHLGEGEARPAVPAAQRAVAEGAQAAAAQHARAPCEDAEVRDGEVTRVGQLGGGPCPGT